MFKQLVITTIFVLLGLLSPVAQSKVYYFGVLAPRGATVAQQQWQPWLDGFNQHLKNESLILVPLTLAQLQQPATIAQLDFMLAPQAQFFGMDTTGWHWLATLQAQPNHILNRQQVLVEQIGSTIWVKKRSPIRTLSDLMYYDIAAVDKQAFGGYLLAAQLLQQQGIPLSAQRVHFLGYPIERTIISLAADQVDAAIAPLCLMEEMAANGVVNLADYRAINAVLAPDSRHQCVSSTKTYPNWTLAATHRAPTDLVQTMHQYLFTTPQPAKSTTMASAKSSAEPPLTWLPVQSSQAVEQVLIDLQRHPSQLSLAQQIKTWIQQHRWMVVLAAVVLVVSLINYVWMSALALRQRRKILAQHQLLQDYDKRLERNQRLSLVGEMSAGLAHELNQPLAVIQNYTQGALLRLDKGSLDPTAIKMVLNTIAAETQRGASAIQNIRQWYATKPNTSSTIQVLPVIQQAQRSLSTRLSLKLSYDLAVGKAYLPAFLLDQLLINTLLNAEQQGATQVWISLRLTPMPHSIMSQNIPPTDHHVKNPPCLWLSITDDGGGFSAHTLSHFDQTQLRPFESIKPDGMGMGLLICQRLCQSIGGLMQINNVDVATFLADGANRFTPLTDIMTKKSDVLTSKLGQGAQLHFYLPLH